MNGTEQGSFSCCLVNNNEIKLKRKKYTHQMQSHKIQETKSCTINPKSIHINLTFPHNILINVRALYTFEAKTKTKCNARILGEC